MTEAARDLFRLDGRVALVTGASSGLGARFATVLHQAGADVVLTARRQDPLQRLANDLGARATVLPGDLREPTVRAALVELVTNRSGRLDILINNAGISDGARLQDQSLHDLVEVFDLNLIAAVDLCRLAAPLLFAHTGSTVINVASISMDWSVHERRWLPTTRPRARSSTSPATWQRNGVSVGYA